MVAAGPQQGLLHAHKVVADLEGELADTLDDVRYDARKSTWKRDALALLLLLGGSDQRIKPDDPPSARSDGGRAQYGARSIATVLLAGTGLFLFEAARVDAKRSEVRRALREATDAAEQRADLVVATEVTHSITEGKRVLAERTGLAIIWEWNAVLDRATCLRCASMHGRRGQLHDFLDGPPPLHPRCRCQLMFRTMVPSTPEAT